MKSLKNYNTMQRLIVFTLIMLLIVTGLHSQEVLTLEKALQIAETESPDL
jgi:hypothetical protein